MLNTSISRRLWVALVAVALLALPVAVGANSLDVNENAADCVGASGPPTGGACNGLACGLETVLVDQGDAYVQSDHPQLEPRIDVQFCFNANGVTLPPRLNGTPGRFRIMKFYREQGNNPRQHTFVTLKRNQTGTAYRMAVLQRDAAGNFEFVGEFFYGNGGHDVQIVWDRNGGAANTGRVEVFRDGVLRAGRDVDLTGWNVDRVRMGAIDEIDAGVAGSVYFDEYVSTR